MKCGVGKRKEILKVHGIVLLCMRLFQDLHLRLYLYYRAHPFKSIMILSLVCTRGQEKFDLTRCCVHCSFVSGGASQPGREVSEGEQTDCLDVNLLTGGEGKGRLGKGRLKCRHPRYFQIHQSHCLDLVDLRFEMRYRRTVA